MATLHLIDTSGFVFRAYYALPAMTAPDGSAVNALYGYTRMALAMARERFTDGEQHYVAAVFDAHRRGEDARSALDAQYKSNRKPSPPELTQQFPLVKQAAAALGLNPVSVPGAEADDVICSYASAARAQGYAVHVISSDKDLFWLLTEGCEIFDPLKQRAIDAAYVEEKFGVGPEQLRDVLALMGDYADNIPGVPGVGQKTAAAVIRQWGSVEGALAATDIITPPRIGALLDQYAAQARRSLELVMPRAVELPRKIEDLAYQRPATPALMEFLERFAFASIIADLQQAAA